MPAPNPYLEFVTERLSTLGAISSRYMFGGYCLYCDGIVFALLAESSLYLKADDVNRPAFESRQLQRFRPFEDQSATMAYYEAPVEIFEDDDELRKWVGGAIEAGQRAAAKKKSKAKRPPP